MKRKSKLITFGLVFIVLLSFLVSAQQEELIKSIGNYPLNSPIEITQGCTNQTAFCDLCNISSVKYPNSTRVISDVSMTKRPAEFNYSISSAQNNALGKYIVSGFCQSGVVIKPFTYSYTITPTGNDSTQNSQLIYIIIILIVMTIVFLVAGISFDKERWVIKTGLFISAMLTMLININIGLDFAVGTKANTMTFWAFVIAIVSVVLIISYLLVYYTRSIVKAFKQSKEKPEDD